MTITLPPELHQSFFGSDREPGAIAIAANGRTAMIVKNHAREIETWRGALPMQLNQRMGLYPSGAAVQWEVILYDRPDSPLTAPTYLNPALAADHRLLQQLAEQDALDVHLFDLEGNYQFSKQLPLHAADRQTAADLLHRADEHNARLASLDYTTTRAAMLAEERAAWIAPIDPVDFINAFDHLADWQRQGATNDEFLERLRRQLGISSAARRNSIMMRYARLLMVGAAGQLEKWGVPGLDKIGQMDISVPRELLRLAAKLPLRDDLGESEGWPDLQAAEPVQPIRSDPPTPVAPQTVAPFAAAEPIIKHIDDKALSGKLLNLLKDTDKTVSLFGRPVATSGGLTFGAEGHPNLDIYPVPGEARPADLIEFTRRELAKETWDWRYDRRLVGLVPRDWTVLAGTHPDGRVIIRLVMPWNMNILDALRSIEEDEFAAGRRLPADLIAAVLVVVYALERKVGSEAVMVVGMTIARLMSGWRPASCSVLPAPLNRKAVDALSHQVLDSLPQVERVVDGIRVLLSLAHELWQPDRLQWPGSVAREWVTGCTTIASLDLLLRTTPVLTIAGVPLRVNILPATLNAWVQTIEFDGIDGATLHALVPDGQFPVQGLSAYIDLDLPDEQRDLLRGLAASLVHEAQIHAHYAPVGCFHLAIPEELAAMHMAGLAALRVAVDQSGFWVRVTGREDDRVIRWDEQGGLHGLIVPDNYAIWLNAVLAALWHDLRVAGEAAVKPERSRPASSAPAAALERSAVANPASRRQTTSVRSLPRLSVSGRCTWSTDSERQAARKVQQRVGHPRQLHDPTWHRRSTAVQEAQDWGILLPDGFTWVRQINQPRPEGEVAPVVVHSKGLFSLIAWTQ